MREKIIYLSPFYFFKQKGDGFTIMEIMVVLAIIGILSAISIPAYKQFSPTLKLNGVVRETASNLRYAQQLAVTEQVNYNVVFNIGQNSYAIINTGNGQAIKNIFIDSQITIDNMTGFTSSTVSFNATGAASESGSITFINQNNTTSTVEVKPSGYVKIKE